MLGALGVVFGDIGTSPLYALKLSVEASLTGGAAPDMAAAVLGVLSLITWSLLVVVMIKYVMIVMRADNNGEGGVFALTAVILARSGASTRGRWVVTVAGTLGAALFFGDSMITPAISVLSAVEGLNVISPSLKPYVVSITIVLITALFAMERLGTRKVGAMFGPVMLAWFATLGVLGAAQIIHEPRVLAALDPLLGARFLLEHKALAVAILGAVVLAVTGGEALYADMGHFGAHPIRIGWYTLVFPALTLNYLGQAAYLLHHPGEVENLFYRLAPTWALYPLVILATAATVIASQAVISGAFSLSRQAAQLGYCPRLTILHTSRHQIGQVYVPAVNAFLLLGTVALVVGFERSDHLAGAYGVAVSSTMLITTVLICGVLRTCWGWSWAASIAVCLPFLLFDVLFFGANVIKIREGGWVSLSVAAAIFLLMRSWSRGRKLLAKVFTEETLPVELFLNSLPIENPLRVPGTAVFLTNNPNGVPRTLLHNFKHNRVIHERVLLIKVQTEEVPFVDAEERVSVDKLEHGFYRVQLRYGFSEDPDVPKALSTIVLDGEALDPYAITFFLGRETLLVGDRPGMPRWRKHIFVFLSRNARDAAKFFRIPPTRVIELGIQVEI